MRVDPQVFARSVRARMTALKVTQAELARRLGVPASNVSAYLSGRKVPMYETVGRYAKALETVPSGLIQEQSELPAREPTPEEMLALIVSRMGIEPARERIIQKALFADPELLLKFSGCLEGTG